MTGEAKGKSLIVQASRSVLVEALTVLGGEREALALVGGWVPELAFPGRGHMGSIDVDLALDGRVIEPTAYNTIRDKLLIAGYRLKESGVTNVFVREVKGGGGTILVKLDLITGEQEGLVAESSHQHIQGMMIGRLRGADLAFEHPVKVDVSDKLPSGGYNTVTVRIPTIAAFLCMKSIAMTERKKEKDAYDIYFCLLRYPEGPAALASTFKHLRGISIVEEALRALRSKFDAEDQIGPVWAAQAAQEAGEDPMQVRRAAYERANVLLDTLGVGRSRDRG